MYEILWAYIYGIGASFTPCLAALYPLFVLRASKEKKIWSFLLLTSFGFISVFFLFALFISNLDLQKVKFAIGLAIVFLGASSLLNMFPNLPIKIISINPLLFGMSIAAIFSTNPCSMPFLAAVLSGTVVLKVNIIGTLFAFSVGILTPILLSTVISNTLINYIQTHYSNKAPYVEKFLSILLIATGLYMIFSSTDTLTSHVIYLSASLILLLFIGLSFPLLKEIKREPFLLLALMSLAFILATFIYHCNTSVLTTSLNDSYSSLEVCTFDNTGCKRCDICGYLFLGAVIFGIASLYLHKAVREK